MAIPLPRIRRDLSRKTDGPFVIPAILAGYPKPGIGLCVDLYEPMYGDAGFMVFPYSDPEAGK